MIDAALLILRVVAGALLVGHGVQKLFGWLGGPGLAGAGTWFESIGLWPGRRWAALAGLTEVGSGLLMALGFLNPIGPIAVMAAMATAALKAHRGKPIWAMAGGPELSLTYMLVALAVALAGPGAYSVDAAIGLHVPAALTGLAVLAGVAGVITSLVWPPTRADRAVSDAGRRDRAA